MRAAIPRTGRGWAQRFGGPIEEVNPGDTVFFEAGEKHWHGDTSAHGMTHVAITELLTARMSIGWNPSPTRNTSKASGSFLKKRTKKLLSPGGKLPDKTAIATQKSFLFFRKEGIA